MRRSYGEYAPYGIDYFETKCDEIKEKSLFFDSPDEVAAKIQDFADAGYNHFVFRAQWLGCPPRRPVDRRAVRPRGHA